MIGIVGLFFIDGGNYQPFSPHGTSIGLLSSTAALTLWAFIGLESATVPAEEVKDPERTIPRATILGTILATLVYIVATVAIMGIIPTGELAASTSPFADAAGQVFGGGWDKVIALVALVSTFGALNGWILIQGRVPLAAAEDGMFPAPFARVSRQAQDAGLRARRLVDPRDRPDAHELHEGAGRRLHLRDPAGHAHHPGPVRLLGGRPGLAVAGRG